MTERLFEKNPYIQTFEATVTSCEEKKGVYHICLDRSAFFPEGGGQPGDQGWLDDIEVYDTHEKDGQIWHYTKQPIEAGTSVIGKLRWDLRLSNMQNHAGEHIVSGLIHKKYGYDNVGFHMGSEAITLDINGELSYEQVMEIEKQANLAIEANLPIGISIPEKQVLDAMEYRSKKAIDGDVRIVEIPGYDQCACCGTHPMRTGEIRLIKILSVQNYKGGVRISMLAGNRALADYHQKHESVVAISRLLSAKTDEVADAVERVQKEMADLKFSMIQIKREWMALKAQQMEVSSSTVCVMENSLQGNDLREFANLLSNRAERVLVMAETAEGQMRYVLYDKKEQARAFSQEIQKKFNGKGGGSPQMVQGTLSGNWLEIKEWFENHE